MSAMVERVVLLAEDGSPIGTADKSDVHNADTPLHLAFSCHVFDGDGRILVTRRALMKKAWPGVWTNAFCGHPMPGETPAEAVKRRALDELGTEVDDLALVLPRFRYRATDAAGIVENEVCPVFTATTPAESLHPSPAEVAEYRWVDPVSLLTAVAATPWAFSPWVSLQLPLLYAEEAEAGSA